MSRRSCFVNITLLGPSSKMVGTMNISFVLLYIFLGSVFLFSAYLLWKKDKNYYMRIISHKYTLQRKGKVYLWETSNQHA